MSNKSTTSLESKLTRLLEQYDARQDTNGVRFALAAPKRGWHWEWSSPGSSEQYFIASTTKLYVTALVMQLRAAGQLDLEAPAARYLAPSVMTGIHVLRGVDSGGRITIRELLATHPASRTTSSSGSAMARPRSARRCRPTSPGPSTPCCVSPRRS